MSERVLVLVQAWPRYVERAQYLGRTLESVRMSLDTGGLEVDFVVSSESQGCDRRAESIQAAHCDRNGFLISCRSGTPSVGGHLNDALGTRREWDWLFYLQEDHEQVLPVDLPEGIEFLRAHPELSLARYMISGRRRRDLAPIEGSPGWSELGPECYEYFFAFNPLLAHRSFLERMGPFSEHQSENRANARARELGMRFALRQPNAFAHIGEVPAMTEKHTARSSAHAAEATA